MTLQLDDFLNQAGEWLRGTGPEADIVISTRARLARNVEGFPFAPHATLKQKAEMERLIRGTLEEHKLLRGSLYINLEDCSTIERQFLVERHLISRDHANAEWTRGVAVARKETISVMVLEEDHLRIQVLRSGMQPEESWDELSGLDDQIERHLTYSFSQEFGYLTACPTNAGTGLRLSVMMHLPALALTKQIQKVFQSLAQINFTVRGLYGEGTEASGHFFQISNQVTLGKSEAETVQEMKTAVPKIARHERGWREKLITEDRVRLEDRVWRSYGLIRHARSITSEETLEHLSLVRLGVNLGLIPNLAIATVNELFVFTQPGHLQTLAGKPLDAGERDTVRADFIRHRLGGEAPKSA